MRFKVISALMLSAVAVQAVPTATGIVTAFTAGAANAQEATEAVTAEATNAAAPTGEQPKKEIAQCTSSESLLSSLNLEREVLEERKRSIDEEMTELELARERLKMEVASLNALRAEVEGIMERNAGLHTSDVDKLVNLYQTMKPQEAANIMNDMDIEVAVLVLSTMNEKRAAPIIARMNPVRAQAISKIILERNKLPGDQKLNGIKLK